MISPRRLAYRTALTLAARDRETWCLFVSRDPDYLAEVEADARRDLPTHPRLRFLPDDPRTPDRFAGLVTDSVVVVLQGEVSVTVQEIVAGMMTCRFGVTIYVE